MDVRSSFQRRKKALYLSFLQQLADPPVGLRTGAHARRLPSELAWGRAAGRRVRRSQNGRELSCRELWGCSGLFLCPVHHQAEVELPSESHPVLSGECPKGFN